jgi:hypothetical protein
MSKEAKNSRGNLKDGQWHRRDFLKRTGVGFLSAAFAAEQLGGIPGFASAGHWLHQRFAGSNPFDAYEQMGSALRGGPALLGVSQAMAQSADDWILVQIKVLNHVYIPMVFALGQDPGNADGSLVTSTTAFQPTNSMVRETAGMSHAAYFANIAGINKISRLSADNLGVFGSLRFNKWFADMLREGTTDGLPVRTDAIDSNLAGLTSMDVEEFNHSNVAMQAFLGLKQIEPVQGNNHALKICKLRPELPDLTLFSQQKGLVSSPLGITCFMMGDTYDQAEGVLNRNAVLGADNETPVVASRTVADYVYQIQQYTGKGYADRSTIEENIIYQLDRMVVKEPSLRRELLGHMDTFKNAVSSLDKARVLEINQQTVAYPGGRQSLPEGDGVAPTSEFLGQCKYVAEASEMPGQPLRNFSLFLNVTDLDGSALDTANINGPKDPVRAYSYIEGMRQLAMGLNVLAKKIAAGKKILVMVHSEGGRSETMQDAKTSFALVMGPKGPGMLDDKLYSNPSDVDAQTSSMLVNPGGDAAARPWASGGLVDSAGVALVAPANASDVQMGVARFLAEKKGIGNAFAGLSTDQSRYVKLTRKA